MAVVNLEFRCRENAAGLTYISSDELKSSRRSRVGNSKLALYPLLRARAETKDRTPA
jgi:hypothetical protein